MDALKEFVIEKKDFVKGVLVLYPKVNVKLLGDLYDKYEHTPLSQASSAAELEEYGKYWIELSTILRQPPKGKPNPRPRYQALTDILPVSEVQSGRAPPAGVLLIPRLAQKLCLSPVEMEQELHANVRMDDGRLGRAGQLQTKRARRNSNIVPLPPGQKYETVTHPKNEELKLRNYSYESVPLIDTFRIRLGIFSGPWSYKTALSLAEINHYFEKQSGIGRHGDKERGGKIKDVTLRHTGFVTGLSLGKARTLAFYPYYRNKLVEGTRPLEGLGLGGCISSPKVDLGKNKKKEKGSGYVVAFRLHAGDVYFMSAGAIGKNWSFSSVYATWRHAAGARKYTSLGKEHDPEGPAVAVTFSSVAEHDATCVELQVHSPLSQDFPDTQLHHPGLPIWKIPRKGGDEGGKVVKERKKVVYKPY